MTNPSTSRTLRAQLEFSDPQVVRDAIETALSIDDRSVIGDLLKGASFVTHLFRHGEAFGDSAERFVGGHEYRGPEDTRHIADLAYLRLLAASDSPLRDVGAIAIDTGRFPGPALPFDDLSWLSEFPKLSKVHLFGKHITNEQLRSLVDVPLGQISVINYGKNLVLPGHRSVQTILGRGIDFEPGGQWPELRSVSLGHHGALDDLFDGSPNLTDLRIDTSPSNWISGLEYSQRDLALVRSATLERATLKGAHFVQSSPQLVELELGGRAAVTGTPNLETLRLGEVQFELGTELDRLVQETGAHVELIDG